jgi:hypothetical protein
VLSRQHEIDFVLLIFLISEDDHATGACIRCEMGELNQIGTSMMTGACLLVVSEVQCNGIGRAKLSRYCQCFVALFRFWLVIDCLCAVVQ